MTMLRVVILNPFTTARVNRLENQISISLEINKKNSDDGVKKLLARIKKDNYEVNHMHAPPLLIRYFNLYAMAIAKVYCSTF